jgi:hypothetical protein
VLIRAAYFRISADGALRGPDNAITATYADGLWQLAQRHHRAFECAGPVYLRFMRKGGQPEIMGPYEFVRAAEGAVFTHDECLGVHDLRGRTLTSVGVWDEIVFLTAP